MVQGGPITGQQRKGHIRTGGYLLEIPEELSAEDCKKPYIQEFYRRHILASNITIQPVKSHEEALARQNPNKKDGLDKPFSWSKN